VDPKKEAEMKKIFAGVILTFALFIMVTGTVFAQEPTPTLTGTVQSIFLETDPTTGETTVLVTLVDDLGEVRTVRISLDTAVELDLVAPDPTVVTYVVVDAAVGTTVSFESTDVLEETDGEETDDSSLHPVGSALSDFFSSLLGIDYETVMTYHEDGVGFGVIAQALWMTKSLEGDTAMFQVILDAKKSGDYSAVVLPDGSSPTNWGQFRQAVLKDKEKAKNNLGVVKSGKAEDDSAIDTESESGKPDKGNKDKDKDKGKGKDKDN
jgi:hypothetical protein